MGVAAREDRGGQWLVRTNQPVRSDSMGHVYRLRAGICGLCVCWDVAHAGELPRPTVDYSADVAMQVERGTEGQPLTVTGKIHVAADRERRETSVLGRTSVVITRRDKGVSWVLMPAQSLYMENEAAQERDDPYAAWQEAGVTLTRVGEETVNGVAAIKFRAEAHGEGGRTETGYLWLTKDNIPVRMATGAPVKEGGGRITVDYTHIQVGKQDPALFEIPADYRKMALPGAEIFMGHGVPGVGGSGAPSPGQPAPQELRRLGEQMQQQMQEGLRQAPAQ